jgi:argininosuccinate lyase
MQEDKEALFDAVDTVETCLEAADRLLSGLVFDRERMAAAAGDELLAATDVADLLVRRGMPFREAHGVVGDLVREALGSGRALSELTADELRAHSELLDEQFHALLSGKRTIESKGSEGGTASGRVAEQIARAREALERS